MFKYKKEFKRLLIVYNFMYNNTMKFSNFIYIKVIKIWDNPSTFIVGLKGKRLWKPLQIPIP